MRFSSLVKGSIFGFGFRDLRTSFIHLTYTLIYTTNASFLEPVFINLSPQVQKGGFMGVFVFGVVTWGEGDLVP